MSNDRTTRGLSQLDLGGVLKNSHDIKAEALRVYDSNTLAGTYFDRADVTYNASGSATSAILYYDKSKLVKDITTLADVSGSLNNKYFLLDDALDKNKYYIWFNVNSAGTDPVISGRIGLQVPLNTNDTADFVATALRIVIGSTSKFVCTLVSTNKLRIENIGFGQSSGVVDFNTSFTFTTIESGVSEIVKNIQIPYDGENRYIYNEYTKSFDLVPVITVNTGSMLDGVTYDHLKATYPSALREVYTYKSGGVSGTTEAVITIDYTTSSKKFIDAVTVVK